jgi:hypothetical protein
VARVIQLAFEPAFDPFHAAFRLLRPNLFTETAAIPIERLQILDVFVAEPRRCLEIRVPRAMKRSAKLAAEAQRPTYGRRPSTVAFYARMRPMQDAALQTLVMQGLFDGDAFSQGMALRTDVPVPLKLSKRIEASNFAEFNLMKFLYENLSDFPLVGVGGLKDRTGLGEYRYDVV